MMGIFHVVLVYERCGSDGFDKSLRWCTDLLIFSDSVIEYWIANHENLFTREILCEREDILRTSL